MDKTLRMIVVDEDRDRPRPAPPSDSLCDASESRRPVKRLISTLHRQRQQRLTLPRHRQAGDLPNTIAASCHRNDVIGLSGKNDRP
jgi:hypothetical protein